MDKREIIGRVLRDIRLAAGLTQEEMAERAELNRSYPSLLERGLRTPSILTFLRISVALKTEPHVLMRRIADSMK